MEREGASPPTVPPSAPPSSPPSRPGSFAPIALGIALMILLAVVVQRLQRSGAPEDDASATTAGAASSRFGAKLAHWGPTPGLELIDRQSRPFRFAQLANKVVVVNFFFTSCPSTCVALTRKVRSLVAQQSGNADVEFVSITVDPDADTPDQLTTFARAQGGESPRWHWLTGTREQITQATYAFFAPFGEKDKVGDIVHSTKLYVVDRAGRIRSMINTEDDPSWFERCRHDVGVLLGETATTDAGPAPERPPLASPTGDAPVKSD